MASTDVRVSQTRLMRHVTMHIRIVDATSFAVRRWLAIRCIKLAALLVNCNIQVEFSNESERLRGGQSDRS